MLLLLGLQSFAYNEVTPNYSGALSRMIDIDHAVSCDKVNRDWIISYIDITSTPNATINKATITVPDLSDINDMRITSTQIYLCGRTVFSNGIFITLSLNDLITPPASGSINFDYEIVSEVSSINKIVVYDLGGTTHLAAVCHKEIVTTPYMYRKPFVLHIKDFPNQTTYTLKYFDDEQILLDDIVVTNNYVALIGHHDSYRGTSIWKCDKSNIFNSMMDTMYYYPDIEALSFHHAAWLDNDEIAVAHFAISPTYLTLATQIRYYKLSNMRMFNGQEFLLGGKGEPQEMSYLPQTKTLILTQHEYHTHPYKIIYLLPQKTNSYTTTYLYDGDDNPYRSVDCYRPSTFFVSQGAKILFKDQTQPTNLCIKSDLLEIYPIKTNATYKVTKFGNTITNDARENNSVQVTTDQAEGCRSN